MSAQLLTQKKKSLFANEDKDDDYDEEEEYEKVTILDLYASCDQPKQISCYMLKELNKTDFQIFLDCEKWK